MRTYLRAASLALTITVFAASGAVAQGGPKLGYINSQLVLQQAPGRAALEAQLKTQTDVLQKRMSVMQDSAEALVAAYTKEQATLTPAVRTQREEAINKKRLAFAQEAEELQQKFNDARETISRPLMEMFNRVLNEVRAEEGLAFIFDVGSEAQVIVAADKNLDYTEKVIARMRTAAATAPKPAATPAKPAGTGPVQAPTGVKPPPAR
jgi:outer membrane protein